MLILMVTFIYVPRSIAQNLNRGQLASDDSSQIHLNTFSKYERTSLSQTFRKDQVESLLQSLAIRAVHTGYRNFGVRFDLFHGHILFRKSDSSPVLILYHNQENASDFPDDSKYGFYDKKFRNVLQWVDNPNKVENANNYRYSYLALARQAFKSKYKRDSIKIYFDAFGFDVDFLDPNQLGMQLASTHSQYVDYDPFVTVTFEFFRFSCESVPPAVVNSPISNFIRIYVPQKGIICLSLGGIPREGRDAFKAYYQREAFQSLGHKSQLHIYLDASLSMNGGLLEDKSFGALPQ
jgi:hypothetical protein